MADDTNRPKGKSPEEIARWRAIRRHVLPKHLAKPVRELEDAVEKLGPLLSTRAKRATGFVDAYARPAGGDEKRAAFEDSLAKADAMCRYLRMEKSTDKDYYDAPILQPMLDGLRNAPSIEDELRSRGISPSNFRASSQRMERIDRLRSVLRDVADDFSAKVNVDTLWNAYRMDFRGQNRKPLSVGELEQNPFIKTMAQTAEPLRLIAQAKAMEKLARALMSDEVDDAVIAEKTKGFIARLPAYHLLKRADWARTVDVLQHPDERAGEYKQARHALAERLWRDADSICSYYRGERGAERLQNLLCEAYHDDAATYLKPYQLTLFESEQRTDKDLARVMETAPHLRDQLSYVRAAAALRQMDAVLEREWRAVADMYPPVQRGGQGQSA